MLQTTLEVFNMQTRLNQEQLSKIMEWECSGKNQTVWCQEKGICYSTMTNWLRVYRKKQNQEKTPQGWVAVTTSENSLQEGITGDIEISIGKYTIRTNNQINRLTFRMVCEELNRIC
jgi:hypothetical protein